MKNWWNEPWFSRNSFMLWSVFLMALAHGAGKAGSTKWFILTPVIGVVLAYVVDLIVSKKHKD
jgi:DMSO reductase anchor subunit